MRLGTVDLRRELLDAPAEVARGLALALALAPGAREDLAVDAPPDAREQADSDLSEHVIGQVFEAHAALPGGAARAERAAMLRPLAEGALARWASVDPCVAARVVSAALFGLRNLGDDTSAARAALVRRLEREETRSTEERRRKLIDEQNGLVLYDLVVAGRTGEALARAEELWAGSAMAAEARAGMATLLAEILELPSRRTPALREQARAWLARAEAVARELKPEGWRAWLEAETKGRYERAARELAR